MKQSKINHRVVLGMLAAATFAVLAAPVFADDDHHNQDQRHEQNHEQYRRDQRFDHGDERHDDRRWHNEGRTYYQQPVYVPPTVYVAPQQSPGVNLFVPLNFRL